MKAHEKAFQLQNEIADLRDKVAFALDYAKTHGREDDAELLEAALKALDDDSIGMGWIAVALERAPHFELDSVPEHAAKNAYIKWFEGRQKGSEAE